METNKLLSIIVPVYKVERYINKCLDSCVLEDLSLMNQLEVIIVNDGTPDNSAEMSREYVRQYPNTFRQIDKENNGHGSAWNIGLIEATGKYLRFLDSDDWLSNLALLMNELKLTDSDLIFTQYLRHYTETGTSVLYDTALPACSTTVLDPKTWGQHHDGYNAYNFWSITYKTSILKPLHPLFAEKVMYDDFILTSAVLYKGRTYSSYQFPLYNYVIGRTGQSMKATDRKKKAQSYLSCLNQYEIVWERTDKKNIPDDYLSTIRSAIKGYANLTFTYLHWLDYNTSKRESKKVWANHLRENAFHSHMVSRYTKLPFVMYYYLEKIRASIKTIR